MKTEEICEKIINDDNFIIDEIAKILTYYQLKHTLRWGYDSSKIDEKESVAEHVFGMYVLNEYFLPLQSTKLNTSLVRDLILWHDMSESLVDDMTTLSKTDMHRLQEREAETQLTINAPAHLQALLRNVFSLYNTQVTAEAKYVKAIDKLEPLFQILFLSRKIEYEESSTKRNQTHEILDRYQENRLKYISNYPDIVRFSEIISDEIKKTKFIHQEAW